MIAQQWKKAAEITYLHTYLKAADQKVGFFIMKKKVIEKEKVEFVGVVLKVNGKEVTFPKGNVSFSASESDCDICGSHGSVKLNIYDKEKSYDIEVEVSSW